MKNSQPMKKVLKQAAIFFIWFYLISTILFNIPFVVSKMAQPQDFGSFIQAGLNAAVGKNPYSSQGDLIFEVIIDFVGLTVASPNLNPPISVVIFETVAKLAAPEILSMIWRLISIALYVVCILFLEKFYPIPMGNQGKILLRICWALSLAGFWHTIEVGQLYIPLVMLFCMAWVLARQEKVIAVGILLGMILSIKPNFFILILLLIAGRYFRLSLISILTFIAISILPFFVYGPKIYLQWFEATSAYNGYALPNNSFVGLMVRFQHQEWGTLLSIALVIFLLILIWRKKVASEMIWGLGISASLLCSPIAWDGYTLFLLPYLYSQKNWLPAEKIGAAILTISFIIQYLVYQLSWVNFVLFGWTYGWGIILILFAQIKKAWNTTSFEPVHLLQNKSNEIPNATP